MHFFYLDETGFDGANLHDEREPIFVLGGISIRNEGWMGTQQSFSKIIERYYNNLVPSNFELHANELLSPTGEGFFEGHDRERRNNLAVDVINILSSRKHDVHFFAIDKEELSKNVYFQNLPEKPHPYLLAYDYLITAIDKYISNKSKSARGMFIIDEQKQYDADIAKLMNYRRYDVKKKDRIKKIVEFSYSIDSRKNPMIQFSDIVIYIAKKFLEIELGYKPDYPQEAKRFYAECFSLFYDRCIVKIIVKGYDKKRDENLKKIQAKPKQNWKKRYELEQ